MKNIILNKQQTKTIAQTIYGDVKKHCNDNFHRYFPWYLNDIRRAKGKPLLKITPAQKCNPSDCEHCHLCSNDYPYDYEDLL